MNLFRGGSTSSASLHRGVRRNAHGVPGVGADRRRACVRSVRELHSLRRCYQCDAGVGDDVVFDEGAAQTITIDAVTTSAVCL